MRGLLVGADGQVVRIVPVDHGQDEVLLARPRLLTPEPESEWDPTVPLARAPAFRRFRYVWHSLENDLVEYREVT